MIRRAPLKTAGFATLVTVAMLIFVSMAVMTLSRLTVLEAQRTQQANVEAQRRQLLLAGSAAALAKLDDEPAFVGSLTVRLPSSLLYADANVTVEIAEADERRTAVVQAVYADGLVQQIVVLTPVDERWTPTSVAIDRLR
ncbi:hypothetical protein ACERK3_19090 [Phycisphaerales bacterium AB-hyl4]|uniref:Uncharacterized protein n=1 Tax=Natronomicrosphaera hydrolytica TaxID=3242702 RepID=A0ABV4UAM9_9BACT